MYESNKLMKPMLVFRLKSFPKEKKGGGGRSEILYDRERCITKQLKKRLFDCFLLASRLRQWLPEIDSLHHVTMASGINGNDFDRHLKQANGM